MCSTSLNLPEHFLTFFGYNQNKADHQWTESYNEESSTMPSTAGPGSPSQRQGAQQKQPTELELKTHTSGKHSQKVHLVIWFSSSISHIRIRGQ